MKLLSAATSAQWKVWCAHGTDNAHLTLLTVALLIWSHTLDNEAYLLNGCLTYFTLNLVF